VGADYECDGWDKILLRSDSFQQRYGNDDRDHFKRDKDCVDFSVETFALPSEWDFGRSEDD